MNIKFHDMTSSRQFTYSTQLNFLHYYSITPEIADQFPNYIIACLLSKWTPAKLLLMARKSAW